MKTKSLLLITLLIGIPLIGAFLQLPNTPITFKKLSYELVAAGIPITSLGRLSRDIDTDGRVVLVDGKPVKVAPYLLIKSKEVLTAIQIQNVRAIVDAHVPDPEPTEAEVEDARREALLDEPFNVARMKADALREKIPYDEIRTNIKAQM